MFYKYVHNLFKEKQHTQMYLSYTVLRDSVNFINNFSNVNNPQNSEYSSAPTHSVLGFFQLNTVLYYTTTFFRENERCLLKQFCTLTSRKLLSADTFKEV